MPDTQSKPAAKGDPRNLARTKRADLIVAAQLAEEEQMKATIDAVNAKIAEMNKK
jgi:phage-related protein